MSILLEIVLPLLLILLMLGGGTAIALAAWSCLPERNQERLSVLLRRVRGTQATRQSGPPIYAVHIDGHLLYASGKDDVQLFLWTAMGTASRQILALLDVGHPATVLFTCGNETILLEVHLE